MLWGSVSYTILRNLTVELCLWKRLRKEKKEKRKEIPDKILLTLNVIHKEIISKYLHCPTDSRHNSCYFLFLQKISCLHYLKSYLRSTMGVGRLNGFTLIQAHRDIPIDLEELTDLFAVRQPQGMFAHIEDNFSTKRICFKDFNFLYYFTLNFYISFVNTIN